MSFSPMELLTRGGIARPLFTVFFAAALKGSVILLLAWGLTRALRHASASIRHLIWTAGLAGVLVMPLLPLITPRLEIALPKMDTPAARAAAPSVRSESPATFAPASTAPSGI